MRNTRTQSYCLFIVTFSYALMAAGCGPPALSVPNSISIPVGSYGQLLEAIESVAIAGEAELNALDKRIQVSDQNVDLAIAAGTKVTIKKLSSNLVTDGAPQKIQFSIDALDLTFDPPLTIGCGAASLKLDHLIKKDDDGNVEARIRLGLAESFGRVLTLLALRPWPAPDSFDADRLLAAITVSSLDVKLRSGAVLGDTEAPAGVALRLPQGATGHLATIGEIRLPLTAASGSAATVEITAPSASVRVAGNAVVLGPTDGRLTLPRDPKQRVGGTIRTRLRGAPIAAELAPLLQGLKVGAIRVHSVEVVRADDVEINVDLDRQRLSAQTEPFVFRLTGQSDRGHGLDLTATLGARPIEVDLSQSAPTASIALPIRLQSGVRLGVMTATAKKKIAFVRVTIVKPVVIEPFDVSMTIDLAAKLQGRQAVLTYNGWRNPSGSIRVGAIGDGPNAWGTINPFTADPIQLRVNYIGKTVSARNPIPGALNQFRGRTMSVPLNR